MKIFKQHQALNIISPYIAENPIIVEAGAYNGGDTVKMAQYWPSATIHAFEPVPEIYDRLQKKVNEYTSIKTYPLALSDKTGISSFYVAEKSHKPGFATQAGSLHPPKERLKYSAIMFPRKIEVQTILLDEWAQQSKVQHVNLLWLDMQGHELVTLKAALHMLKNIDVIFTEVAFIEAYEKQPHMNQVISFLNEHDFVCVARDFVDEKQWFFGNLVFVSAHLL